MTFIPDKKQTDTRYPVLHPKLLFPSRRLKADTHQGFCSRSMLQDDFARVSTHEGALFVPGACSQVFNRLNIVEHFAEILLPRMKYTHEIVGTYGGTLLPECAPGACSGSKIPRVYRPYNTITYHNAVCLSPQNFA